MDEKIKGQVEKNAKRGAGKDGGKVEEVEGGSLDGEGRLVRNLRASFHPFYLSRSYIWIIQTYRGGFPILADKESAVLGLYGRQ